MPGTALVMGVREPAGGAITPRSVCGVKAPAGRPGSELLAGVVAIALSPLAPLGPVRPYLSHGVTADWTVLGVGLAIIVLALVGVAVLVALRMSTPRVSSWRDRSYRRSAAARAAASANLPVSAVTGIRFALEPGVGRNTVPVRSAIFGAVLAVVIVTSTITFGASLQTLVSKPALYG